MEWLQAYQSLPNYVNNFARYGFALEDVSTVTDRFFDAIFAWGDEEAILSRIKDHQSAGADHVCIQALGADLSAWPVESWRRIAAALQ